MSGRPGMDCRVSGIGTVLVAFVGACGNAALEFVIVVIFIIAVEDVRPVWDLNLRKPQVLT